jgi:hypothetical protein
VTRLFFCREAAAYLDEPRQRDVNLAIIFSSTRPRGCNSILFSCLHIDFLIFSSVSFTSCQVQIIEYEYHTLAALLPF